MIAMSTAAKATPDGYTVLLADPSLVINPTLIEAGYPAAVVSVWGTVLVPAGTP
jgi:hypothetical protein